MGEVTAAEVEANLIASEIALMRARLADGGPAWQVTRYQDLTDSSAYIAISAYHHLVDGIGGLQTSLCLLFPERYPLVSSPGLAPRMEDLIRLTPSIPFLLTAIYQEHIAPLLPSFFPHRQHCWPAERVGGNPATFSEAQFAFHIPASWIGLLKSAGQAQGVPTLHPIIEAAFVVALHEVMDSPAEITALTPLNERDISDPTHPQLGNMISGLVQRYSHSELSFSLAKEDIWSIARSTSMHHASTTARKESRYMQGVLAFISDPKSFSSPHGENPDRRTKTGWEELLWSGIERPAPCRASIGISNLGKVALPPGCNGMRWSRSATPFDAPLSVSVVGHELGLEVGVAFRDGFAVTGAEVESIVERFKEVLGGLI